MPSPAEMRLAARLAQLEQAARQDEALQARLRALVDDVAAILEHLADRHVATTAALDAMRQRLDAVEAEQAMQARYP